MFFYLKQMTLKKLKLLAASAWREEISASLYALFPQCK